MDEVYQRELKWVGLIGMEGKEIDTLNLEKILSITIKELRI